MVAIKLFGIIIVFHVFMVRDASAQNFYPARYGKRNEIEFRIKPLPEEKRLGFGDEENALTDRKIRFFFSGGRYGKRRCSSENSEKCFDGSNEIINSRFFKSKYPNDRINVPIRKNQFMTGSRFGKRMEESVSKDFLPMKKVWCAMLSNYDFQRCSLKSEFKNHHSSIFLHSNYMNEIKE